MSGLRVIAGQAGGIRLKSVPGDKTRPITDLVKGALFDIIGIAIFGSKFLDLFGGTGSVGIEALSRGARLATIIEINRTAIETIKNNLDRTHLRDLANVLRSDAFAYLKRPVTLSYDFIFVAPPQYKGLWKQILELLDNNIGWLNHGGWVIIQIHPVEYEQLSLKQLSEFDRRHYGSTELIFYENKFI